ncbi:MAG: biopolymer transporter ExbD [candidate division KSB1 bacterium]
MHAGSSSGDGTITNMQLAPLIDIALVLVIIFMVTAPRLDNQSALPVDLPKAATIAAKSQDHVTLTLTRTGEVALNETAMPQPQLEAELRQILAQHPERLVMIRADKQATHKQTLEMLALAKRAGAKKLAIATLQRTANASHSAL